MVVVEGEVSYCSGWRSCRFELDVDKADDLQTRSRPYLALQIHCNSHSKMRTAAIKVISK